MKISFFQVTSGKREGGGLETYCWELGKTLAQRGHEVTILAGGQGFKRNEFVNYEGFPFRSREDFPNLGQVFRKLLERISFAKSALPSLLTGGYDIVIINKPTDFPAMWWAKRNGLKANVVFSSGGRDFYLGDGLFAGSVDTWVSCSDENSRKIGERYGRNVTTIYNGVDTGLFSPGPQPVALRKKLGLGDGCKVIMSVGRLVDWKGLDTVIRTLAHISDIYYVAVGGGPARNRLENLAKEVGVGERVIFTGVVDNSELVNFYRLADITVQPSVNKEAFSIALLEAMACGVPVLAAANMGMEESVINNKTGRLVNSRDPRIWGETIKEMIKNGGIQTMGIAARKRVERHFTWDINADKLEKLIAK
ncbi:glycosyltransferase family 4 protein [Candidatus Mycalebacterium sp.]